MVHDGQESIFFNRHAFTRTRDFHDASESAANPKSHHRFTLYFYSDPNYSAGHGSLKANWISIALSRTTGLRMKG